MATAKTTAAARAAAETRDRPLLNANFVVELGAGKSVGFAEVVFAPFAIPAQVGAPTSLLAAAATPLGNRVVLRRGATGALDLYEWWNQARHGQAPARRVVKVKLLGEDHSTVLMTWRFRNVKPLSLAYSALNALEGAILMETIELAFDDVEMS
jgi:T4-like virus tail tube protein gp19